MASFTLHLRVVTYDPDSDQRIGVPQAEVRLRDRGNATVSQGGFVSADGAGRLTHTVTFADDVAQPRLQPSFSLKVPQASRAILGAGLGLPANWDTAHEKRGDSLDPAAYADADHELELLVGLPLHIELAYCDFHESENRNPMALPENTLRFHVADEDITGCFHWLNPEDVMKGRIGTRDHSGNQDLGLTDRYPYYDKPAPLAPYHGPASPHTPRAWIHPPGTPAAFLGGTSFEQVGSMCCDNQGFVFVIDGDVIQRFYPDGSHCETLSQQTAGARYLVTDRNRNLYVSIKSFANTGVAIFDFNNESGGLDRSGTAYRFAEWIRQVVPNDPFAMSLTLTDPWSLALFADEAQDEFLAVANQSSNTSTRFVALFRLDTGHINRVVSREILGLTGAFPNEVSDFGEISGLAALPSGHVLVADKGKHRIWKHRAGAAPSFWGKPDATAGNGPGQYNGPTDLAYDSKNNTLYVVDQGNQRLLRLNPSDGTTHMSFALTAVPTRLCCDPRGETYLGLANADPAQRQIQRYSAYNASGQALALGAAPESFGSPWRQRAQDHQLYQPGYVHVDAFRHLWVCDTGNRRVLSYDLERSGAVTPRNVTLSNLDQPVAITSDSTGKLYVAEAGANKITRFSGSPPVSAPFKNGITPRGLCSVRKNGVEAVLVINGNQVLALNLDGGDLAELHPPGGGAFGEPVDVCQDGAGNIYVLERNPARLLRLNQELPWDGGMRPVAVAMPVSGGNALQQPSGVWADASGRVYVTDKGRFAVFMLDQAGSLLAWWDMEHLIRQSLRDTETAEARGQVTLDHPNNRVATRLYYGAPAWEITAPCRLTLTKADATTQVIALPAKAILLVDHNATVAKHARLAALPNQQIFEPDLARLLVLREPCRAVTDGKGLLMICDRASHRIHMLRIHSDLEANILEPDERFPDVALHTRAQADWTEELGLRLTVGEKTWCCQNPLEHATDSGQEHELDFSGDTYKRRVAYNRSTRFNEAVNTMNAVRQLQSWLVHHTREDGANAWGSSPKELLVDITLDTDWSVQPTSQNLVYLASDASGRGADTWDDAVVVHESSHWLFGKSIPATSLTTLMSSYDITDHYANMRSHQTGAIVEGFAEYMNLFWGSQYERIDRVRGFDLGTLKKPFRFDANQDRVVDSDFYGAPESYLVVEGYYANVLYQLQQLAICPGMVFADHPAYHYRFNHYPSTALSALFCNIFRQALRDFPLHPSGEDNSRPVSVHLRLLRARFAAHLPAYLGAFDAICELNNLVLPRLVLKRAGSDAPASITLHANDTLDLVAEVRDAWGNNLVGYSLTFGISGADQNPAFLSPPAPGAAYVRGFKPSFGDFTTTDAQGRQTFHFTAPAVPARREWTFRVAYQSAFYKDPAFTAHPTAADDLLTCERKLYLNHLRFSAGQNLGAEVTRSVQFVIEP